jgi:sirohydrochlorin ferrochelatase
MLELSAKRFTEAVRAHPSVAADKTHLILVGRGSNDAEAIEAMRQFTRLRCDKTPVGSSETCFIAMASPSLKDVIASIETKLRAKSIASAARKPAPRPAPKLVVVQPHLLFRGGLLAQVASVTQAAAARTKNVDWLVTNHLGPDELLVRAIVEIADATSTE